MDQPSEQPRTPAEVARPAHLDWKMWRPMSIPAAAEPQPMVVESAAGAVHLVDSTGQRHLDMTASLGYVNVGYDCAEIRTAIQRQLARLPTFSSFGALAQPVALELAERLMSLLAPESMSRVLFSNSGSDAMETAIKLSMQYWRLQGKHEKRRFISLKQAYHGVGLGGLSATGLTSMRNAYGPSLAGFHHIDPPYSYRYPGRLEGDALALAVASHLEREICFLGPETVSAVIAEPIQCAGGMIIPPEKFWPYLRHVCDFYDILLIADEVVTGFGRTGSWFGARLWQTRPDIACFAKGINSGYIPLGATVFGEKVAQAWELDDFRACIQHGYTYSGHPVACAAALASLEVIERDNLVERAGTLGTYLLQQLEPLKNHPLVGEIRGRGLMVGIELISQREQRMPLEWYSPAFTRLREVVDGLNVRVRWANHMIILTPPFVIQKEHIDECVAAIGTGLDEALSVFTPA
jgi:putrescine aminotransferase